MKQWIRFCMYEAYDIGDNRYPQICIMQTYPDAEHLEPQSIADAWFFYAEPKPGQLQPKPFSLAPRYVPTDPHAPGYVDRNGKHT